MVNGVVEPPCLGENTPVSKLLINCLSPKEERKLKEYLMHRSKSAKAEAPKTAIIYTRVSSADQMEGHSLQSQDEACRKFASQKGLAVLRVFREEAESAKTADRPELQKLLKYCSMNKRKIGSLIIYKVDRFARNQADYYGLKVVLQNLGITVVSASEGIANSPEGQFMEGMLAAVAQYDNSIRAQRTAGGMRTALMNGQWVFKAPFGYAHAKDIEGKKIIVPDKERAPIVKYLFEECAKGIYTFQQLGEKAMAKFRIEAHVSEQLVNKVVSNPFYYGRIEIPDWNISVAGKHIPIVSKELFDKVQSVLHGGGPKRGLRNRNHPDFPLRGIKCAVCGHSMTGCWTSGKQKKKYAYYACGNRRCEKRKSISKVTFENLFSEFLTQLDPNNHYFDDLAEAIKISYKTIMGEEVRAKATAEKQIAKLRVQLYDLFQFKSKGDKYLSDEQYVEYKSDMEKKLADLQAGLRESNLSPTELDDAIKYGLHFIQNFPNDWKRLEVPDLRAVRSVLFPKNLLYADSVFQTPELCLIYGLNQQKPMDKNVLVAPRGIEPRLPA